MDNDIAVELRVDGAFVDITNLDDANTKVLAGIVISRGSDDAQDEIPPGDVKFRFLDNTAYLDPGNPSSPLWRRVGPGTDVQVKVDGQVQVGTAVELKSALPNWDDTASAIVAQVTCSDITDRLSANQPPLDSALTRYYTSLLDGDEAPLHWWTFEEGKAATRAEDSAGRSPLTGIAEFGASEAPAGGVRSLQTRYSARPAPLSDLSTYLTNATPTGSVSYLGQSWAVEVSARVPGDVVTDDTAPVVIVEWRTHGLSGYWQLQADYVSKCAQLYFFNNALSTFTLTGTTPIRDGDWHHYRVTVIHAGADFNAALYVDGALEDAMLVTGARTSVPKLVRISNFEDVNPSLRPALCHLVLWGPDWAALDDSVRAFRGYAGEAGTVRLERLGDDEGIQVDHEGSGVGQVTLGPQGTSTFFDIAQSAAATNYDLLLAHPTVHNALLHRLRSDLLGRPPSVRLTYAHLAPGFRPSPDDQRRVNQVRASTDRSTDRSATAGEVTYTIPDDDWWHWTTQPPPDGAYARPTTATFNPNDAAELVELAAWKAHLSAWREKRYAQITLLLHSPVFTAPQIAAIRQLDVGDVIEFDMADAPPWVPYDTLRVQVRGFTRQLDKHTDTYALGTVPADPWEVELVDGDTILIAAIDADDTTALLENDRDSPSWSTTAEPYHIQIDGDPCTVTAMSTATPAFIAAGTPAHADNAAVVPALPAGITADQGQSLFCFAAIRSGSVNIPAGWTAISFEGLAQVRLFHRYYATGVVAPTVTPSGGAAGDTVSAVVVAFSGVTPTVDSTDGEGGPTGGFADLNNASAQNIAYPALTVRTARTRGLRETNCLQFVLGWKADDYTSVLPPSGFTEMFEASTTTGNDQSLYGAYRVVSDPTAVVAGSLAVTGGAAAVSRGFTIVFRPLQTATIVRNVAGVATSHTEGDPVHVWRPGLVGL